MEQQFIKPPVEVRYREELEALKGADTGRKPENWRMSPRAVRTFILGSPKPITHKGKEYIIEKKYLHLCGWMPFEHPTHSPHSQNPRLRAPCVCLRIRILLI